MTAPSLESTIRRALFESYLTAHLRVLSLWQPWATPCVAPDPMRQGDPPKAHETRHWAPRIPVPFTVAIHAAKKFDKDNREHFSASPFREVLKRCGYYPADPRPLLARHLDVGGLKPVPRGSRGVHRVTAPTRPVLRYHGGKWRLAPWIIAHFPPHKLYVEPYGGGASVLMRKPRSGGEVYNDLDCALVNVFRVLRDPEKAARLERGLTFTPYARAEFEIAHTLEGDDVERARRTIVRALMGHGGTGTRRHRTGFRPEKGVRGTMPTQDWASYPPQIARFCERLRLVAIECVDALKLIAKYDAPTTLFYVDPPYPHETRTSLRNGHKQHYHHEMQHDDHVRLAGVLAAVRGAVVISGYACPLYDDECYRGWERHEKRARADGGRERVEVVWIKPASVTAERPTSFVQASFLGGAQ